MRKAFTMIELVFILVVIGILAATIIPRTRTNPVQEAAIDLVSKIRYTQHLALINDKYDAADNVWFKNRWQIVFAGNTYSIQHNNGVDFAKDTLHKSKDLDSVELKGLDAVTLTAGCNGESIISFDYLGRPLLGTLAATTSAYTAAGDGRLLSTICTINLTNGSKTVQLDIHPETGYVRIR